MTEQSLPQSFLRLINHVTIVFLLPLTIAIDRLGGALFQMYLCLNFVVISLGQHYFSIPI